jgi:YD repeat-containing protein
VTSETTSDGSGAVLSSVSDAAGAKLTSHTVTDAAGRVTAEQSPAGVVTKNDYNASGQLDWTVNDCVDTPPAANWYDCSGNGQDDGTANQKTSYTYYDSGKLWTQTSPTGLVTSYTYDDNGQVLTEIDNYVANYTGSDPTVNLATSNTYDIAGRQTTTTDPTGEMTATVYDTNGNVCRTIGNATFTADALVNVTCTGALPDGASETASANIDTQFVYNAAGQKIAETDPSPADGASPTGTVTTDYAYNSAGQLCRVIENATFDLSTLTTPCTDSIPTTTTAPRARTSIRATSTTPRATC